MEKTSVFSYSDYKAYLRAIFLKAQNRGLMTEAAEAINCSKSYLSRSMNEKMDLSQEQGYRLSLFLRHSHAETEYFSKSIELSRSNSPQYRDFIKGKMALLKAKNEEDQKKGNSPTINPELGQLEYFLKWYMIPLHLMTSFKKGISVSEASGLLNLPTEVISEGFKLLEKMDYITVDKSNYVYKAGSKYLPPENPLLQMIERNLKDLALRNSQSRAPHEIHFSTWYSVSEKDFIRIKELILQAIESVNRVADPSPSEKIVALAIDWFDPFTKT